MALLAGFLAVALLGMLHHGLLRGLDGQVRTVRSAHLRLMAIFIGLLAIHTAEILLFAALYAGLLAWGGMGGLGPAFDGSWEGLIYFSGINFATLGYTQLESSGPLRLINMMQSLGGFMVLTWSATFIYSAWEKAFR